MLNAYQEKDFTTLLKEKVRKVFLESYLNSIEPHASGQLHVVFLYCIPQPVLNESGCYASPNHQIPPCYGWNQERMPRLVLII